MASRTRVVTETTVGERGSIETLSYAYSEGDSVLDKEIAGDTAKAFGAANALAHSKYFEGIGKAERMERYREWSR